MARRREARRYIPLIRRILYVQYTNPAAYPPLEHSSRILADGGWQVLFVGTRARGSDALEFLPHPNITVRRWKFQSRGLRQKFQFFAFNLWAAITTTLWKPKWIYASELLACPAALVLKGLGHHVLYHEHDSPEGAGGQRSDVTGHTSGFQRFLLWTRKKVAQRADLSVLPNEKRVERFKNETGRQGLTFCVWNCPRREEAAKANEQTQDVTLYYHGNISAELLPMIVLEALAQVPGMQLLAIGYTTDGNEDYPTNFRNRATELGLEGRIQVVGPKLRGDLLAMARRCTIGWAVMPIHSRNLNLQSMVGASNKTFDYLACGLPLLVSDSPDWKAIFVEPGYGQSCNLDNPDRVALVLRWFLDHREEAHAMGERGRQRVLQEWNYERQFEPVLRILQSA